MKDVATATARVAKLIHKGKAREAFHYAFSYYSDHPEMVTAEFCLWYDTAATLSGKAELVKKVKKYARTLPDYTPVLEGDVMRELAIGLLRQGEPALANFTLYTLETETRGWHNGDVLRIAANSVVKARAAFACHEFDQAVKIHQLVFRWLESATEDDPTIGSDNLYHWLKVMVALETKMPDERYRLLLRGSDWRRRWRVRLLRHFAPLAQDLEASYRFAAAL